MKKEITISGRKIEYRLERRRGIKNLCLTIGSDGCLVASRPWYVGQKTIELFIMDKSSWIIEKMDEFKEKYRKAKSFVDSREAYLLYKKQAERIIAKKVKEFNEFYQFDFAKIVIRNQKTRWGSCSARGILNFNYKLIFLPHHIIDYVVVHELCHLKEMNHSIRFWNLVTKKVPDYKAIRVLLHKKGLDLR
ncbi:MAG: M48 family metallopeptidase [Candidatus Falkowbacteria bacterium]